MRSQDSAKVIRIRSVSSVSPALQHSTSTERGVNIYTAQSHLFSKNSLIVNTTNNLAKLKEMFYNLFNLSTLKTKQQVKETCKPHVQWRGNSNINVMQ